LGRSKGDSPDAGGSAPGVVCRRMHISIPGNWASNNPVFAISHGPCAAAPSTPSQCPALSRHAAVPSRFPVQVRRVTQRLPPPEPLLSARVIQRRVRRRNFPRYAAFPRSEYYGGSAPPAPSAGVAPIPTPIPLGEGKWGTYADGSHVHCCPVDGLGTRLYPCGIATATAVANSPWPPGSDFRDPA